MKGLSVIGLGLLVAAAAVYAAPKQAEIPFATTSGIEGWRAEGDNTLYIKGARGEWYKADLFGPCFGLEFDPTIGFVTRFGSTFDRSSSLLVDGHECRLSSLTRVDGPPDDEKVSPEHHASENAAPKHTSAQKSSPEKAEARIPFANLGGIRDWRAIDDHTLYVQGRGEKWYRVELLGPCTGLPFEHAIGFVAEPLGSFDRFSSIVVEGRECPVSSVTAGVPPRERHEKQASAAKQTQR